MIDHAPKQSKSESLMSSIEKESSFGIASKARDWGVTINLEISTIRQIRFSICDIRGTLCQHNKSN